MSKCPYSQKSADLAAPQEPKKCPFSSKKSDDQVKSETADAYNKVGETAFKQGNLKKAEKVMKYLDYTDQEFSSAGPDAYNYQGVGCPFRFVDIKRGDVVLDVGSGLGIDSTIAANKVGLCPVHPGRVIGLDLSEKEVSHANNRMKENKIPENKVKFITGDMENMPKTDEFKNNTFDVVISNGAFCLAPNKEKAFQEIFRVLKPGGKMSICTSVVKMDLDENVKWPLCMEMFIHKDKVGPLCEKVGFENVKVDDSNSLMQYDIEGIKEVEGEKKRDVSKNQVHNDSEEFRHLRVWERFFHLFYFFELDTKKFKKTQIFGPNIHSFPSAHLLASALFFSAFIIAVVAPLEASPLHLSFP